MPTIVKVLAELSKLQDERLEQLQVRAAHFFFWFSLSILLRTVTQITCQLTSPDPATCDMRHAKRGMQPLLRLPCGDDDEAPELAEHAAELARVLGELESIVSCPLDLDTGEFRAKCTRMTTEVL